MRRLGLIPLITASPDRGVHRFCHDSAVSIVRHHAAALLGAQRVGATVTSYADQQFELIQRE
jgi:hypothetical protein